MKHNSSETALSAKTYGQADMLKAFHDRLRDLCAENGEGAWQTTRQRIEGQAKQARTAADEFGILKSAGTTWAELRAAEPELDYCAEHIVEFSAERGGVGKT